MKRLQIPALLIVSFCAIYGVIQLRNPAKSETNIAIEAGVAPKGGGKILFVSDIHLDPQLQQTTDYGHQDAGMDIWASFLWKVDQLMQAPGAPEFVIYTGDLPVHGGGACDVMTGSGLALHDTAMSMVLDKLRYLSDRYHVKVFYLPGNNDALNGDYMPFADASGQTTLSLVAPAGGMYPTECTDAGMISCHPEKGYYSAYAMQGLRVIALNTVMYNNTSCTYNGQQQDCSNQMQWLGQQLQEAAQKKEKCFIAMHIPPGGSYNGMPMWNSNGGVWVDSFLALTAQYSSSIAGIFYGHTHLDEMRLLYAPGADTVTELAVCCPGLSILHKNNPGFKVVTFDRASKELLDFTTYYSDIPVAPQAWPNSYTFSQLFGAKAGQTMQQTMTSLPTEAALSRIGYIYKVRHGSESPSTIANFYTVKATAGQ